VAYENTAGYGLGYQLVAYAARYFGVPYVWGGESPSGFDCSGLVAYVYAKFGITLPHSSQDQAKLGVPVSRAQLQPGDLLFFDTDPSDPSGFKDSHVAIYAGNGQEIEAPHTGDVVKLAPVDWSTFDHAMRVTGLQGKGATSPASDPTGSSSGQAAGWDPTGLSSGIASIGTTIKNLSIILPFIVGGAALTVWGVYQSAHGTAAGGR
jgi:cell wall-associated NlpC family hydrolase